MSHLVGLFTNHIKIINSISDLKDATGDSITSFDGLDALGVNNLSSPFKEPIHLNMGNIMKVLAYFPKIANDDDNAQIFKVISSKELVALLSSF